MKMIQANGMIDTNNWQKDYIWQYHEPIQIGTRLCEMVKSGYLVSNQWKKYNYYTLTDKGIDWNGEELIIKQYPKIKKTRAESEVKEECKEMNFSIQTITARQQEVMRKSVESLWIDKCYGSEEWVRIEISSNNWPLREKEAPPYKFSFVEWIKSILS